MLITLDEAKTHLGITDGAKDAFLTQAISNAGAFVENFTGKSFEKKTVAELLDGDGSTELVLSHCPIVISVDDEFTLESRDGVLATDPFEEIPASEYHIDQESGIVKGLFRFREEYGAYKASYSYGYATVPADVKQAVLLIVQAFYQTSPAGAGGNVKSEKIDDYSVTYKDVAEVASAQEEAKKILSTYQEIEL